MDVNELLAYLVSPAAQIALIIGLAEIIKKIGLQAKWIPLIDVGFGLLSGILYFGLYLEMGIPDGILIGVAMGLSACGLFSGVKNIAEAVKGDK